METNQSVILLEFNELCPSLMGKFITAKGLPNFKRFYSESEIFITDAEEEGEALNPWVQWVTAHTGLSAAEHGIQTLSEGHELKVKTIWDLLSDAGFRVWVCGSMNCRYDTPLNGLLLPDPWSTGAQAYPPGEFDSYEKFIRKDIVAGHYTCLPAWRVRNRRRERGVVS